MPALKPRDGLAAALAIVHALLAAYYGLAIPLGEAPDEVPHYHFVRFRARERRLPAPGEAGSEGLQPPLYYALGALLTAPIPEGDFRVENNPDFSLTDAGAPRNALLHPTTEDWPYRGGALAWHLIRLLSAAMGGLTVYGIYRLGREVFPEPPAIALGAAAFAALLPGFLATSGAINNDNAIILLTTWSLFLAVRLANGAGRGNYVALGVLTGLAILAKSSGLVLLGLFPVVAVLRTLRGAKSPTPPDGS